MSLSFKSRAVVNALTFLPCVLLLSACGSPEQKAQGYYDQAIALIAKHDDVEARKALNSALKYKSDNIEVWRALAGVDERTKAGQALFQDLRRIVELDPNDNDARLKLASIMVAGGAAEPALKLIETIEEGDKPNAALHALKATILMSQRDLSGALREAQRTVEIDPSNVSATTLLAAKKIADGDGKGALQLLDGLPAERRSETRVQLERVQAFVRMGDLPQAEIALRKLVAENPGEPGYRAQLIQFLIASRRLDEAEKELRSIADASPGNTKAGLDVVRFLLAAKGAAAGRDELNARIKAGGDTFDYQIALAELDQKEGHFAEAADQFKNLAKAASSTERKLSAQTKLAELYVGRSDFASAEPIIADILQQDHRNIQGLRLRAAIRVEQGNFDAAIADLREALNDQPKSVDLLLLMATAYERSGKNELADRQYADALKASDQNPNVALRYVGFLQRRGDPTHAEDVLGEVVARNPNNVQLLTNLAQLRLSRENWPGALAVADSVAKLNGGEATADQIRAAALAGQKRFDESVTALEAAHAAAPDALQPVVNLVSTYIRLGKIDKANDLLEGLLKKYPDNAEIYVLRGQTRMAQNKPDEAEQSFRKAIEKQPKDANGYNALTGFYVSQKKFASAIDVVQSALLQQPENLNFRTILAGLHIQAGDTDKALAEYEAILKDQPGSLLVINNLVSLTLDNRTDKDSIARAVTLAERLKGSPQPQFEDTYGWAAFKRGDYKDAIATLEAAKSKVPNLAAVRYHLGMSYQAAGDPERAAVEFKAASDLEPDGTALKKSILSAMKQSG